MALDQWVAGWMAQREYAWELRATERALFHRLHTECCRAFDAWVQAVQWWLFGLQIGHHGRLRVLREALQALVAAAVNRRQLLVALGHYRYGGFHRGWHTWRAHAQAARAALGARLKRAVRHMLNRQLARGWHAWVAFAETRVAARAKGYRALVSLLHQALARALRGWVARVEQASAANAKRLRAIASLFNQKLARALRGWVARVEQASAANAKRLRAIASLFNQKLARALRGWVARVEQAADEKAKRLRAIASLFNQKLSRALRGWVARVEQAADEKAKLQTTLATLLHQALARTLRAWCAETAQWKLPRSFLKTSVHRWRERVLYTAFVHWSSSCVHQGRDDAAMRAAGARFLHAAATRAWNTWCAWHAARARLLGLARALLQQGLRRALNTWQATSSDLAQRQQLMTSALRKMQKRELCQGWLAWAASAPAARRWRLMECSVRRLHHRDLYRGWLALEASSKQRRLQQRSLAAWRGSALWAALQAWRLLAGESTAAAAHAAWLMDASPEALRRMRIVMDSVARRLRRRVMHAWSAWSAPSGLRRRSAKTGVRRAVWYLLSPSDRAAWPKIWTDFFGWSHTWRDLREWLTSLQLYDRPTFVVPKSHAGLVSALQQGHLYEHLIYRISRPHERLRRAVAGADATTTHIYAWARSHSRVGLRGGPPLERPTNQQRDEGDGWRHLLRAFFASELVHSALGEEAGVKLGLVGAALGRAGANDLLDHLRVLCALRAVSEMHEPSFWVPFVASISRASCRAGEGAPAYEREEPRLTPKHPLDDYSECPAHAACDFVCLGCPTPRILIENVMCGRCGLRATMSTLEYGALFSRLESGSWSS